MEPIWTDIEGVLVVGAGAAGLRAAIAVRDAGQHALVLSSRRRDDAHTVLAAGGINAVLGTRDPEDSWQQHCVDTHHEGRGLSDPRAAQLLAREAPDAIIELERWGCPFARTADGRIDQRYFGAHRYRRTCYVDDRTGRAVLDTLVERALQQGVEVRELLYVTRLIVADGRCRGVVAFDLTDGRRHVLLADAVVLAAGGHSGLWDRTSSRGHENMGEGMALAMRAGCRVRDLEFVQFHPSGMVEPEAQAGTLVSEAVRGEGAHLLNDQGERFMARYDPDRMELSTRDQVAYATHTEIAEGRGTEHRGVWLDATHLGREAIEERLPETAAKFREVGIDIASEKMEIAPTAHYSMGGVVVDADTQATDVEGLYAAGEVTGGLHGANRLGGNSLAETVVFGRRAGAAAARQAPAPRVVEAIQAEVEEAARELDDILAGQSEGLAPVERELGAVLTSSCGVVRSADGLKQGLDRLQSLWSQRSSGNGHAVNVNEYAVRVLRLRSAMLVAEVTIRSAAERTETRGAHIREDHPEPYSEPQRTLARRRPDGAIEMSHDVVPSLPPSLAELEAAQEAPNQ